MTTFYCEPEPITVGRAMWRVSEAIKKYAPEGATFLSRGHAAEADVQILQYWTHALIEPYLKGKRYVIWFHCNDGFWDGPRGLPQTLVDNALLVTSWQPLPEGDKFLELPLGAEPSIWFPENTPKVYKTLSTGYVADSESLWEVYHATRSVGGRMVHVGGSCINGDGLDLRENISDEALRHLYCQSEYVSGLRRGEGFEIPLVEGLMSGTRGLCFSRPDQKHMAKWCQVIEERTPAEVEEQLREVLSKPPVPISEEERAEVVATLSWGNIIPEFWTALMERL